MLLNNKKKSKEQNSLSRLICPDKVYSCGLQTIKKESKMEDEVVALPC